MTSPPSSSGSNLLGVITAPLVASWSAADVVVVLETAARRPTQESDRSARLARHRLSLFWLACPADVLEQLYATDLGEAQRLLIKHPQLEGQLLADEQLWRQQLQALLQAAVGQTTFLNHWLALMPYLKVGELRLDQPEAVLPSWLLNDYRLLCEPNPGVVEPLPLTQQRGDAAIRWLQDEAVLARAVVLLNGFQLDPQAPEQAKELADLRAVVAQVWLDIDPEQLQGLFESPLGLLTRSLVAGGFNAVTINERERAQSKALQQQLQESSLETIPQHLLAALLYEPSLNLSCSEADLPGWFQEELRSMLA